MQVNVQVTLIALAAGLVIFTLLTLRWAWRRLRRRERRAIAGLQAARNRMHSLFSQVGFMAFSVNRDGILTWVEGSDVTGLGLTTERSTGRHYTDVFESEIEWQREIRRALAGDPATRRVADHSPPYDLSIRPVFDQDGRATEAVAAIVDITDELRETDRAERLARFRTEFLSAMNFRLRAPLSGIVGVTGLLARSELADDQRESVEVIEQSSDTLLRFIDDLIDYGELDAGRLELDERPFDLRTVLDGIKAEYAETAAANGLSLVVRYPYEVAQHFSGDAPRIRQIISNLVSNAVRFTTEGHVLIDIHETERQVRETTIAISVEDTGPGIPAAEIEHLFEGFGGSARVSSSHSEGTGLGLAISRQLAWLMGGELTVNSRPGIGNIFTLKLDLERVLAVREVTTPVPAPVATRAAVTNRAEAPATGEVTPVAPVSGRRALIAEDSLVQQKVVARMLGSLGFEVTVASDGLEAVEALEERSFDIVFMDCQMPRLDGFEATARIREFGGDRGAIPIVAMTADAMSGDRERCLNAGMNDYLSKPVNMTSLQEVAERWASLRTGAVSEDAATPRGAGGGAVAAAPGVDAAAIGTALDELRALTRTQGDPSAEVVSDLIETVLSTAPAQLIGARDGLTGGEAAAFEYWLTPYRTSCRLLGATESERRCGELLGLVRSGDFVGAEDSLAALERGFLEIRQALQVYRASTNAA